MISQRLAVVSLLAICGCALLTGCDNLTRSRFEMIEIGHAERFDVQKTIGDPSYPEVGNEWHYERVDKHLNVLINFDEQGKVERKRWLDSLNNDHYDSKPSGGDTDTYESTEVRTIG